MRNGNQEEGHRPRDDRSHPAIRSVAALEMYLIAY